MPGLLSTYCQAARAGSSFSVLDLVGLSIQRDRVIYQNCRLLIFMSLVAIYMLFFFSSPPLAIYRCRTVSWEHLVSHVHF